GPPARLGLPRAESRRGIAKGDSWCPRYEQGATGSQGTPQGRGGDCSRHHRGHDTVRLSYRRQTRRGLCPQAKIPPMQTKDLGLLGSGGGQQVHWPSENRKNAFERLETV